MPRKFPMKRPFNNCPRLGGVPPDQSGLGNETGFTRCLQFGWEKLVIEMSARGTKKHRNGNIRILRSTSEESGYLPHNHRLAEGGV